MPAYYYCHDPVDQINTSLVGANLTNQDKLADIEELISSKSDQEIIITVDDGYKSIGNLLPLLEETKTRCVLFVCANTVRGIELPYEPILSKLIELKDELIWDNIKYETSTLVQKNSFFYLVHKKIKTLTSEQRSETLDDLFSENQESAQKFTSACRGKFLNEDDLRDLSLHPLIEIGSHGLSHQYLPTTSNYHAFIELRDSKRVLSSIIGKNITSCSYPYGANNSRIRLLALLAGYKKAFTTSERTYAFLPHLGIPRSSIAESIHAF